MVVVIQIRNKGEFQLLYSSAGYAGGLNVTGYLIYPDLTKSSITSFVDIGDGIYAATFTHIRKTQDLDEKYGIVIKENGDVKYFGFIKIIN